MWLGREEDEESVRAVVCSQDPESEEDFQKRSLVWLIEEMKEKEWPRVRNLRARGATVDVGVGSAKFPFAMKPSCCIFGIIYLKGHMIFDLLLRQFLSLQMSYLSQSREMACCFKQARISHVL